MDKAFHCSWNSNLQFRQNYHFRLQAYISRSTPVLLIEESYSNLYNIVEALWWLEISSTCSILPEIKLIEHFHALVSSFSSTPLGRALKTEDFSSLQLRLFIYSFPILRVLEMSRMILDIYKANIVLWLIMLVTYCIGIVFDILDHHMLVERQSHSELFCAKE